METVEAAWISQTEKRIADLEKDRDEDRKKLEDAHREIERLKRLQLPLQLGDNKDYTKFTDGLTLLATFYWGGCHAQLKWYTRQFAS